VCAELINEIAAAYEPRKTSSKATVVLGYSTPSTAAPEAAGNAAAADGAKAELRIEGQDAPPGMQPAAPDGADRVSKQVNIKGADMLNALAALASPELEPGETDA
jgi:surfactin synthase thioesterase subunit